MIQSKITKAQKRDGQIVDFDASKIQNAIFKALTATGKGNGERSEELSDKVIKILEEKFQGKTPNVEDVQNIVEEVLIKEGLTETVRAYIIYRDQRRRIREAEKAEEEVVGMVDQYLKEIDWEVHENANMAYSLQGLNNYLSSNVIKKYWLDRIYPKEIKEAVSNGDFHIHDLQNLSVYCVGWDLYDLLLKGFGGVEGKIESKPPRHFQTALGQLVNFFYTLQGEAAGAVAISSFDTLLAPFIRYDRLSYSQVKQALQEFLFNCSVPTRVGFQSPFTNLTLDINPSPSIANQPVIIGGKLQEDVYGDFQEEMNVLNKAFYELMMEGDAKGRPFTFPIPTINITPDFSWDEPSLIPMWQATAKYGVNYFANFIHSDMKPEDTRSMCCRLRLDNRELYKRGGGLFGSQPLTGSIGVVTIDMPRIGYLSKTKKEFFERLTKMMDLARESLEIKRKILERFTQKGLYPYSKYWLAGIKKMRGQYWGNHFSTIGLIGMNEASLNFMGEDIGSEKGKRFAEDVLDFMRKRLVIYQEETGNLYNLEASPAEGTSYRLAKADKEKYPDIITAGKEEPYYTNSTQLPVNYTTDVFESLKLQDKIQTKYTGGTVLHLFLGERISDIQTAKNLVKKVFENFKLPYITITPTFSICPVHGYLSGEHFYCPKCTVKQPCEVYSRVVGYLRPIKQWNAGKQEEFKQRREFKSSKAVKVK